MSNVDAPDVGSGEINNPDLLSQQSGTPNMSSTKTFTVDTNMRVNGDLDVTGTVTATSFIGDGSQLTGIVGGGVGLDSAGVTLLVDSDYVQARETPQDFAYSSLTGAPTALSSFTNDTNYITAADIPATVDSDYVAARAPAASGGLDSAGVTALINEPYLRDTLYDVATAQTNIGLDAGFASTSNFSIAIGKESGINSGNATNSIALGFKAGQSISDNSIMIGRETGEVGAGSYSVGIGTEALGIGAGAGSVAIGYFASKSSAGSNSVAVGRQSSATGDNAIAIGNTVTATTADAVTIGSSVAGRMTYDTTNDWTFGATVNAPAFVGDGSGLTGLPSGGGLDSAAVQGIVEDNILGGTSDNGVVVGKFASATGNFPISIGYAASAVGSTLAIGQSANAETDQTFAIGSNANARSIGSMAIGHSSRAETSGPANRRGNYSLALGYSAETHGNSSIAIGANVDVEGENGIGIGSNADVTTDFGVNIRTSAAGSLTYSTDSDWVFGAPVTATSFEGTFDGGTF